MRRGFGLGRKRRQSLTHQAFAAIRRAGGTVLAAGAATPVLGVELVTNGDFSNGTTGWDPQATATLDVSGGMMEITCTGAGYGTASRTVSLVIGKTYWLQASSPDSGVTVRINNATLGSPLASLALTSSPTFVLYTATEATVAVTMHANSNVAGTKRKFGPITLKEFSGYTYGNPPVRNYFDSAGTDILDSVTQVDQPVGLVLDGAGTVGPSVFSDAAVVFGGESSRVSPGVYRIYSSAGAFSNIVQSSGLLPYKTYRLRFYQNTATAGTLAADGPAGSVVSSFPAGVGEKECVITMTASVSISIKRSGGVTDIQISNVRIEELTGNHATQPTTGSKPTLRRGLVNQLLWSGDFSNAAWVKQVGATVGAATADPDGGNAAVIVGFPSSGAVVRRDSMVWAGGSTGTVACWVRKSTTGGANAIRLTTNNSAAWNTGISQKVTLTSSWQLVVMSGVLTSTGTLLSVLIGSMTETSWSDTDCVGNVDIYRAALYQGTVTAKQILAAGGIPLTTTAPASSALGNYWWQFDPAAPGDFLQTSITTGNEGWVCAGVNFADANVTFFSSGTTAANAGVWLYRNVGGAKSMNLAVANGSAIAYSPNIIPSANTPVIVSGGWTATTVFAGVDNTETATTARGGPSASTLPLRIGMATEGSYMLSGAMSVTVICPTLPPSADRALIRAWVAKQQGQTL